MNRDYDLKFMIKMLIAMGIGIALLKASGSALSILFFPAILIVLGQKRIELLVALLMVLMSFMVTAGALVPKNVIFFTTQRISLALIAFFLIAQNAGRKTNLLVAPFITIFFYVAYMAVISLFGWQPLVSELKIVLFITLFTSFMMSANAATAWAVRERLIRSIFLSMACYFIFGSFVTRFFPSVGYSMLISKMEVWGTDTSDILLGGGVRLFSGMTWHSQTLGPLLAVLNSLIITDYLINVRGASWIYRGLILVCPILVYWTSSRTAMGAYVVSWAIAIFFILKARSVTASRKSQIVSGAVIAVILGLLVGVSVPQIRNKAIAFVFKQEVELVAYGGGTDGGLDSVMSSRQALIDQSLYNFKKSPLIGNGFQVSSVMEGMKFESWKALLSAPIEKGFLPAAILEEGGIFGAIMMVIILVTVYFSLNRYQAYCGLATFLIFFITNMGEFSFFSMSGNGGILWSLVFMGVMLDAKRIQRLQRS